MSRDIKVICAPCESNQKVILNTGDSEINHQVNSEAIAQSPAKYDTATKTLIKLEERVSHLPTLCIKPATDIDLHGNYITRCIIY